MYVCICSGVTDSQIRSAAFEGATRLSDLNERLGVAIQCGTCAHAAEDILAEFGAASRRAGGHLAIGALAPA